MEFMDAFHEASKAMGYYVLISAGWDIYRFACGETKPTRLHPLNLVYMWFPFMLISFFFR